MFNNAANRDRWGNLRSPEPPAQTVRSPTEAWLGQGNTTGLPPVPPPPPHGPSSSDYPPPPSFPLTLPPPSPTSTPTGGASGFSTAIHFENPGAPLLPPDLSSASPTGGPLSISHVPNPTSAPAPQSHLGGPSDPEKRYAAPTFPRPRCDICRENCVNVREGGTSFCHNCFRDALRRRGEEESSEASRPVCTVCEKDDGDVRQGEMSYCEGCWQESLRMEGH